MKNLLILFTLGISTFLHSNEPCNSMVRKLLVSQKLTTTNHNKDHIRIFLDHHLDTEITLTTRSKVIEYINQSSTLPDIKYFRRYLYFLESLNPQNQLKAVQDFSHILDPTYSNYTKRFIKLISEIEIERVRQLRMRTRRNQWSSQLPNRTVFKETKEFMDEYERLALKCSSNEMTQEKQIAKASFKKFKVGMGVVGSTAGYSTVNWDKEKDAEWFKKLGYDVGIGVAINFLVGKALTGESGGPIRKTMKSYAYSKGIELLDLGFYPYLFSADEKVVDQRFQEYLNDPQKRRDINKLQEVLDTKGFYAKFKEQFFRFISFNKDSVSQFTESKDIDWNNLLQKDLSKSDIQDAILSAIIIELYQENAGWIKTGDIGADRYVFNAAYSLFSMPKDVWVDFKIYSTLCRGMQNPVKAFWKAAAIFTLNRAIFDPFYFWTRRKITKQ